MKILVFLYCLHLAVVTSGKVIQKDPLVETTLVDGLEQNVSEKTEKVRPRSRKLQVVSGIQNLFEKLQVVPWKDKELQNFRKRDNKKKLGDCQGAPGTCGEDFVCKRSTYQCIQGTGEDPIPGCIGTGKAGKGYCYNTRKPLLHPLSVCQGDCDSDSDCKSGLRCHQRGTGDNVPGCTGVVTGDLDYCVKLLGECQGHCEDDWECMSGLKCSNGLEDKSVVPGCAGTPLFKRYYCFNDSPIPLETQVPTTPTMPTSSPTEEVTDIGCTPIIGEFEEACLGEDACLNSCAIISGGSCDSKNSCENALGIIGLLTDPENGIGWSEPACQGPYACKDLPASANITGYSCIFHGEVMDGEGACQASSVTLIGTGSCLNKNACSGSETTATVGQNACAGESSCRGASGIIHGGCNMKSSCEGAAGIIGGVDEWGTPMPACDGDYACKGLQPSANVTNNACSYHALADGEGACQDSSVTVSGNSCSNKNACSGIETTATVGDSSCTGEFSCQGATGTIGRYACAGESSCRGASGIIHKGCNMKSSCEGAAGIIGSIDEWGAAMAACDGDYACKGLQPSANVTNMACSYHAMADGEGACQDSSVTVSGYSCSNKNACSGIETTATVGDMSCSGEFSCQGATGTIGDGACMADSSCRGAAGSIGQYSCSMKDACREVGSISPVTIGDSSCMCENCCKCFMDGETVGDSMCNTLDEVGCCSSVDPTMKYVF